MIKVRVTRDGLRFRATPSTKSRILSLFYKGDILDLENVEEKWVEVFDPKTGFRGWVWRDFVEELPPPQPDAFPPCSIEPVGPDYFRKLWAGALVLMGFGVMLGIIWMLCRVIYNFMYVY